MDGRAASTLTGARVGLGRKYSLYFALQSAFAGITTAARVVQLSDVITQRLGTRRAGKTARCYDNAACAVQSNVYV